MNELTRLLVIVRRRYNLHIERRRAQPDYLVALDSLLSEALQPDPPPEPETSFDNEPQVSAGVKKWHGCVYRGTSQEGESKTITSAGQKTLKRLFDDGYYLDAGDYTGYRRLIECFGEAWSGNTSRGENGLLGGSNG